MSSSQAALQALRAVLPDSAVITEGEALYRASFDNLRFSRLPSAVIRPKNEEELARVLRLANQHLVPVTTRGAGSATTGAATPVAGGWVVDLSGWQELQIDADSMIAYVQPGVTVEALDAAAREHGLFYPPDPGSKRFATLGGTIACNAGGLRGAKYGVTRDYIYGLEGFLPTGEFTRWGLDVKKYVSGYNVRDLWIGSEGTLGVITGAVIKLLPVPATTSTLLARFPDEASALDAAHAILRAKIVPSILEFLDRQTVSCFGQARTQEGKVESWLQDYLGGALLLLELDGHPGSVGTACERVESILGEAGARYERAADEAAAERLWTIRRGCSQAMFALGDTKLNEDIVVPLRSQHELLRFVRELGAQTGLATPTFGHAADGNFHVHLMYDRGDPEQRAHAKAGVQALMERVITLGGAITGEHGIGLAKTPFLALQHEPVEIRLMQAIKHAFDPNGILNPDKLFTSFEVWDHEREDVKMPWDH